MAKPVNKIVTSDAEIDAAIAEAALHRLPEAVAASYDLGGDAIAIRLADGVELRLPRRLPGGSAGCDAGATRPDRAGGTRHGARLARARCGALCPRLGGWRVRHTAMDGGNRASRRGTPDEGEGARGARERREGREAPPDSQR